MATAPIAPGAKIDRDDPRGGDTLPPPSRRAYAVTCGRSDPPSATAASAVVPRAWSAAAQPTADAANPFTSDQNSAGK